MRRAPGLGQQRTAQYEVAVVKPLKQPLVCPSSRPLQKAKYPLLPLLLLLPLPRVHHATVCPLPLRRLQQLGPHKPASNQASCGAPRPAPSAVYPGGRYQEAGTQGSVGHGTVLGAC